jgi:hypothetical protein
MALNANRVSANAAPGMVAAATARPASGGRNVASSRDLLEEVGFSTQVGINDSKLWRYDEETQFDADDESPSKRRERPFFTLPARPAFVAETVEAAGEAASSERVFLSAVLRGIGVYEAHMRIITPGGIRAGSVLNYRI